AMTWGNARGKTGRNESMHPTIARFAAAVVIGVSAGGITLAATSKPDVVNFSLNWFPFADHAAYYSALALRYYEKESLAVNILQGSGSGASVRRVDIGQGDCGIADTAVIINGIRNGADVKIVAMEFDHTPNAVWTTKKSGITKVTDLTGKSVGASPDDAERI